MDRETIAKLLQQRPFQPFELHMSSGGVHVVRHPEMAFLSKSKLIIVDPATDALDILALLHIVNINTTQAA